MRASSLFLMALLANFGSGCRQDYNDCGLNIPRANAEAMLESYGYRFQHFHVVRAGSSEVAGLRTIHVVAQTNDANGAWALWHVISEPALREQWLVSDVTHQIPVQHFGSPPTSSEIEQFYQQHVVIGRVGGVTALTVQCRP